MQYRYVVKRIWVRCGSPQVLLGMPKGTGQTPMQLTLRSICPCIHSWYTHWSQPRIHPWIGNKTLNLSLDPTPGSFPGSAMDAPLDQPWNPWLHSCPWIPYLDLSCGHTLRPAVDTAPGSSLGSTPIPGSSPESSLDLNLLDPLLEVEPASSTQSSVWSSLNLPWILPRSEPAGSSIGAGPHSSSGCSLDAP